LTLPLAEIFIYRQVWPLPPFEGFKAFLTKRVYNEEVMGYSGEFYLFLWARRHISQSSRALLAHIRDNNILSAVTSTAVAFALIGGLVYSGQLEIMQFIGDVQAVYWITGAVLIAVLIGVGIQFRRHLFSLPMQTAGTVAAIYLVRFLIYHGLLMLQWMVVIPDTSFSVWLTFLAAFIALNRLPLPSRDMIFVGAGIELSRILGMAMDAVAGMLLVMGVLQKTAHLSLFLIISYTSDDPDLDAVTDADQVASFQRGEPTAEDAPEEAPNEEDSLSSS
ncbi:MAG: hypothetical protein PPP56_13375, partial [Longimonas sp.]|uniref:hypothetical protein n=1 Tax=Longimonas sp. TaxID=2039626 RepID=UPI0033522D1D